MQNYDVRRFRSSHNLLFAVFEVDGVATTLLMDSGTKKVPAAPMW